MTPLDWTPTGLPVEQVAWPPIAPSKTNRTAVIWNLAVDPTDKRWSRNLWLTKVTTGWNLSGSFGQSNYNRIFYPRNLSQQPLTIQGQMPNQLEYDKLVWFVKCSHELALNQKGPVQMPLRFALPPALLQLPGREHLLHTANPRTYRADAYWDDGRDGRPPGIVRRYYRPIYVDGYITGIKAGHPRWNFAPKFTMELLISQDNLDEQVQLATQIADLTKTASTLAKTNDVVFKNYQVQLSIGKGSVNDSPATEADLKPPAGSLNEALQNMVSVATDQFGDIG